MFTKMFSKSDNSLLRNLTLNEDCLHNIGAVIFHTYGIIHGHTIANTQKHNIKYLHIILEIHLFNI
jgi:hypothetical protein